MASFSVPTQSGLPASFSAYDGRVSVQVGMSVLEYDLGSLVQQLKLSVSLPSIRLHPSTPHILRPLEVLRAFKAAGLFGNSSRSRSQVA